MLDRDEFFQGYLDGILFTESVGSADGDEATFDDTSLLSHGCTREDFEPETLTALRGDCEDFLDAHGADVERYCELRGDVVCAMDSFGRTSYSASECAGSDFWLSRNGHGAGYFDRGDDPVFDRLQDAARVYAAEVYVYFDGEIIRL